MKKFLLLACMLIAIHSMSQVAGPMYVAIKSGLNMRESKDAAAKVLVKIPYGTKITINYPDDIVNISTENLEGAWAKTSYNGKVGYVVNSYLLPWPPPKATVQTMKQYLAQVSLAAGAPVIVKKGSLLNIEEGGSVLKKQLFKNGAEYHEELFYEANNDTYFLPDFTMQQAFILLRLIPEFNQVFNATDVFPNADKTIKRGDDDYVIKVEKEKLGDDDWVKRIVITFVDGASFEFEMLQLGNELVISFGGGV